MTLNTYRNSNRLDFPVKENPNTNSNTNSNTYRNSNRLDFPVKENADVADFADRASDAIKGAGPKL